MAPVENSLAGSIHAVWDLLALYKPAIVGEIYYHVRHCLIGHPGARLEDIRYVYSHPQALAQCGAFLLELENLDPNNIVEEYDTAGAVEIIRQTYKKEQAAIASSAAAELHQMKVLATDIQTHERNYTRFLVLGQRPATTAPNKTVLVCTLDHTAANLRRSLQPRYPPLQGRDAQTRRQPLGLPALPRMPGRRGQRAAGRSARRHQRRRPRPQSRRLLPGRPASPLIIGQATHLRAFVVNGPGPDLPVAV